MLYILQYKTLTQDLIPYVRMNKYFHRIIMQIYFNL